MENQLFRMKELKNSREKNIKKLTKVLNTLVNLEWEISATASKTNDNISKIASKSIAESSSCIQTAISKLISTEINFLKDKDNDAMVISKKSSPKLQSLRKVVLNKK
tara:strand:+ start:193 stop:513 length:321 start_codon:yes stop_codon:yes gene_type:complete